LNRALRAGRIAGAALDVFEPEPPRRDNPLLDQALHDQTLFSPHTAGFVREGLELMPRVQLENCLAALSGERPQYIVNDDSLSLWKDRSQTLLSG
jgi:D-3-phosphoglycerate dehydrogenase